MTPEELDAIEVRANAATPGPWRRLSHSHLEPGCRCLSCHADATVWQTSNMLSCDEMPQKEGDDSERCDTDGYTFADATFIAAARTDIPALIAALREAWAEVERMRDGGACDRCLMDNTALQAALDRVRLILWEMDAFYMEEERRTTLVQVAHRMRRSGRMEWTRAPRGEPTVSAVLDNVERLRAAIEGDR